MYKVKDEGHIFALYDLHVYVDRRYAAKKEYSAPYMQSKFVMDSIV